MRNIRVVTRSRTVFVLQTSSPGLLNFGKLHEKSAKIEHVRKNSDAFMTTANRRHLKLCFIVSDFFLSFPIFYIISDH